jgi:hypothetical protein
MTGGDAAGWAHCILRSKPFTPRKLNDPTRKELARAALGVIFGEIRKVGRPRSPDPDN